LWRAITQPGGNFVFLPEPTTLRFVADWRRKAERARERASRWIGAGSRRDRVPSALRFDVAGARNEQEAVWRRLSAAPERECREIRHAVVQLHDSLLWMLRGLPALSAATVIARVHQWLQPVSRTTYPRRP
jgi:hypothetical protein